MTEEFVEAWVIETSRVQDAHPLLSWEACEMIAYNTIQKRFENESNDRQVS